MLELNDGRSELWQWDTGRKMKVDADCSQVHFSNKVFGRSIDMDVVDGVVDIPDILLQTDKDLTAWAFVGVAENGYTKISKTYKVNRRNKPSDYVFTPPEQTTLGELVKKIDKAVKSVNGVKPNEEGDVEIEVSTDGVKTVNGTEPDENGNVEIATLPDDTEQLAMLIEADMLPAVYDADGKIMTDESGRIVLRY